MQGKSPPSIDLSAVTGNVPSRPPTSPSVKAPLPTDAPKDSKAAIPPHSQTRAGHPDLPHETRRRSTRYAHNAASTPTLAAATAGKRRNASVVNSLRIATFTLWSLATLTSLALGVVADVFQADRAQFPLAPVIGTSIGLSLVAVLLVLLLGKLSKRGFAVFQPFSGGHKFALMQAAGYTLSVFSALGLGILVEMSLADEASVRPRYGAYVVLSAFAATSQLLLVTSLLFFHSPRSTSASASWTAAGRISTTTTASHEDASLNPSLSLWDVTQSPAREYTFAALCAFVMVVSAGLAEVYPEYRPFSVVLVACFLCAAMATVSYLGRLFVPTYRMFTLTPQAASLTVLQLLGNAFLLLCLCGCLMLHSAHVHSPPSWHLGVALVGVTGICCHELLLRLTQSREKEAAAAAAAFAAAAVDPLSPLVREYANAQEDRKRGSLNGAVMSTAVSFVLAIAVYAVSMFASVRVDTAGAPVVLRGDDTAERTFILQGLHQVQTLLVVLLLAMPPFTHLQGRLVFGKVYEIWQPFKGSVEFILLQAAAWASYACAILFGTLQASEPPGQFHFLLLLTTSLLLSQLFVHVSLYLFDESKHGPLTAFTRYQEPFSPDQESVRGFREGGPAEPTSEGQGAPTVSPSQSAFLSSSGAVTGEVSMRSLLATVVNGEFLLSLVLSVVSMLIRSVCDTVEHARRTASTENGNRLGDGGGGLSSRIPTNELIVVANLLSLVATPIAQLSMHDRIPLLHVASTSVGFTAMQTIAWLVYLTLLFLSLVSAVTKERHFFMSSQEYLFMEYSAQGLLLAAPLICVIISDVCEAQERVIRQATTVRVRRAADALIDLLNAERPASAEQMRRASELIRAVAGPRLDFPESGSKATPSVDRDAPSVDGCTEERRHTGVAAHATAGAACDVLDEAELERVRADKEASIVAARYITAIMCLACIAAFASAGFLADSQPVTTLLFGVAGVLVLSLSCVSMQYVLGNRLHGETGKYSLFMPFVGGRSFVVWQAVGWTCYTLVVCLIIACVVEGRGGPLMFFVMTVLSVLAEAAIFHSIPLFNADAATATGSGFLGRNAEGILAAVILLGTFSFARAYDLAREGSVSSNASALVPLVIMSVAMCLTVPMGLLSLQRQAEHYGVSPFTFLDTVEGSDLDSALDESDHELGDTRTRHRGARADEPDKTIDGVRTTERNADETLDSRSASEFWGSLPMTPATREDLIRHARTESLASPSASPNPASRRSSFLTATPLPGSPASSVTPASPLSQLFAQSPLFRDLGAGSGSGRRGRASSYTVAISYAVSLLVALFLVLLLPFAVVFMGYSYAHDAKITYAAGVRTLELLVTCFVVVVTLPMVVAPIARRSRAVRWVHSALCAWGIYSIPTITVLSGLSPPLLVHTRGAWLFAFNMCTMACLSTIPYVHLIAFIFSTCCCGYFAQYHLYDALYRKRRPFVLWQCVADMSCALFWLWYGRRYVGRPEVTGRYQSNRASRFFQKYFFEGMSHWFSLKVVKADLYTLPSEEGIITLVRPPAGGEHADGSTSSTRQQEQADDSGLRSLTHRRVVDRSQPENQYLLSFHPHGVFPGTAIYAPKTFKFERVVGTNAANYISTHCADIVFSVPLMREFPMCLGSLSVGRAGIEHSIKAGNSPLIVTGGQSEMLLVRMSSTEMHLVCHHLGFVKIALRHKIPLVPLLSFSECNIMDNVHCLGVQRWFLKRVGFPFPTLPHGFFKLPLPTNTPMTMVVGPPLMPLPGRDVWDDLACQEELRIRYFCHLEYLFYRYRATAGYPEMKLYLHYGVDDAGVLATPPGPDVDVATEYVLDEENSAIRRAISANRKNREAHAAKKAAREEAARAKEGKKSQ